MSGYQPPYEITETVLNEVSSIVELTEKAGFLEHQNPLPMLRRENRIKSIHSSLAIEQNTLSLEQVTAVLNGKPVLAPPKDIREVQNAFEIYEKLDELDPYSVEDLLQAHRIMMSSLVPDNGEFRSGNVGVVKDNVVIHMGTLPQYVPESVERLLNWVKNSSAHMLVKSAVFHYEFELIHPFSDGNGRTGRLWHTLLLSKWQPLYAWLPIESMIYRNQEEYYRAINESNAAGNGTAFLEFMLKIIQDTLVELLKTVPDYTSFSFDDSGTEQKWNLLLPVIQKYGRLTNRDVQKVLGVSASTANRLLARLCTLDVLEKEGSKRGTYYELKKKDFS